MFTNADLLHTVAAAIGDTPTVRVVIYDGELDEKSQGVPDKIKAVREGITVISIDELREIGKANPSEPDVPKPDDLACIMYTCVDV